jgi:hypothetical protein
MSITAVANAMPITAVAYPIAIVSVAIVPVAIMSVTRIRHSIAVADGRCITVAVSFWRVAVAVATVVVTVRATIGPAIVRSGYCGTDECAGGKP